ncbi:MCP four helix bundle domain-containing protein, partial [Castellaniella denitrificans]
MRNLKIGTRLALGFGLLIILLLIMSGIGAWRMIDSQRANDNLEERQTANTLILQWARQVEVNANQALAAANLTNPDVLAVFKKGMEASDKREADIRARIEAMITSPETQALYGSAMKVREAYTQGRTQAFKDLDNGDYAKADAFFNQEMPKITAHYIAEIDKLSKFQGDFVSHLFSESAQAARLGLSILAVATLLALILGPLFAWLVTRSITGPLRHAVELAGSVARRDLSRDIQPQGKDEVTSLEQALRNMGRDLRNAVGEIRSGSDAIASASAQISAGNLDLSSRTEQQASSLAETAATMEEITATVRQNADNAQQANTLAASAAKT